MRIVNSGSHSGEGNGNDNVASIQKHLSLHENSSFGSNTSFEVINQGVYTGNNTVSANYIGVLFGSTQLPFFGSFNAGDGFKMSVHNSGECNTVGADNLVGYINGSQLNLSNGWTLGNDFSIQATNNGICDSDGTSNLIGYINDHQVVFGDNFIAGNNGSMAVVNSSVNNGGLMSAVGQIEGVQLQFQGGIDVGNDVLFSVSNSGSFGGVNTAGTEGVGVIDGQMVVEGKLNAGDNFQLQVANLGNDTGAGAGGRSAASFDDQVILNESCQVGDRSMIAVVNEGVYKGSNETDGNTIAFHGHSQLSFLKGFQAGNDFMLQVGNRGEAQTDSDQNDVGYIENAQLFFNETCQVGGNAQFNIANSGQFKGNGSSNQVGKVNQAQALFEKKITASDRLSIRVANQGAADGGSYNQIGLVETGQLLFLEDCIAENDASIVVSNYGEYSGTGSSNVIGLVNTSQLVFENSFAAGKNLNLVVTNQAKGMGGVSNEVGAIANEQLHFLDNCVVGDSAQIGVSNYGEFYGEGTSNVIGSINASQAVFESDFTAGDQLKMVVQNGTFNEGRANNLVGNVNGSQLVFENGCTFGNKSQIVIVNTGKVEKSQVVFNEGFSLTGGKATIKAYNAGTFGDHGITVLGNSVGGDVNVILGNSTLYVDTAPSSFTIGELNGDLLSTVESRPTLIINTDAGTNGNFSGIIKDFFGTASTLIKEGKGTQILSGDNTYTGLTLVNRGDLVLTGSIAKDMIVNANGTLKGIGSIGGDLEVLGTISPGMSIGRLNIAGNFTNDNGTYDLEINHKGESDLIDVGGNAVIEGGRVNATLLGDLYQFYHPYTILRANRVIGKYSSVKGGNLSPMVMTKLKYDPTHVYFIMKQDISRVAETHNQKAVARQLDSIHNPTNEQNFLLTQMVNLSSSEAREALDTLSGYQHTDDMWVGQIAATQFIRRLYDPLRPILTTPHCACDSLEGVNDWFQIEGGSFHLSGNKEAGGLRIRTYEISAGIQNTFCKALTLGVAGSYQNNRLNYLGDGGHGKNNLYFAGFYGLYRPSWFYGLVELTCGMGSNTLNRSIEVGVIKQTAKSRPKLNQYVLYGEAGVDLFLEGNLFQPFIGIEAGKFCRHHVREKSAQEVNLNIYSKDWTTTRSRLGMHASCVEDCIELSVDLAWNRFLSKPKNRIKGRFRDFGDTFTINGIPLSEDSVDYGVSLTSQVDERISVYLEVAGEAWKRATDIKVVGGMNLNW